MSLHLLKLAVGCESPEELVGRQAARLEANGELIHPTRHAPRRSEELLAGGSLYWVIRGVVLMRQRLLALRPMIGDDGRSRCAIVLAPELVLTEARGWRPFQGWRYLDGEDAPLDRPILGVGNGGLPPDKMRQALLELKLL